MAIEADIALARARRAYERGRAKRALALAAPVLLMVAAAALLGSRRSTFVPGGLALLGTSWFFLWRGQTLGRAVLPGVLAGVAPLVLALAARSYGHLCTGDRCMSLCIPACSLGGLVAGALIARTARDTPHRGRFIVGASTLAVLVGALGCSCVGFGGIAGLGLGLALAVAPATLSGRARAGT